MRAGWVNCSPAVFCANLCQALPQGAFSALGLRTSKHPVRGTQVVAAGPRIGAGSLCSALMGQLGYRNGTNSFLP